MMTERRDKYTVTGTACRQCGHRLPDVDFREQIGPWCPHELELAARGVIHPLPCPACGVEGHLALPVACAFVDLKRIVIYIAAGRVLPARLIERERLLKEVGARLGALDAYAVQVALQPAEIPGLLQIPDFLVEFSEPFSPPYRARLWLHPSDKARVRVDQLFEIEKEMAARAGEGASFGFAMQRTPFENSDLGRAFLKEHLSGITPTSNGQAQILDVLDKDAGAVVDSAPSVLPENFADIWGFVSAALAQPSLEIERLGVRLAMAAHHLCNLNLHGVAADLCEGYFLNRSLNTVSFADVRCAVAYAQALFGLASQERLNEVLAYLDFALHYLPQDGDPQNEELTFIAGFAHEYAGRCLKGLGRLPAALTHFMQAGMMYRLTTRQDALHKAIVAALPLTQVLGDEAARQQLDAWIKESPAVSSTDPVLEIHSRSKQVVEQHNVRKVTHKCTDWSAAVLTEEERKAYVDTLRYVLKPLNFVYVHGQAPPPDAVVDIDFETTYEPSRWKSLIQSGADISCEAIVAQHLKVEGRDPMLLEEVVVSHPVLAWMMQAASKADLVARLIQRGDVLWNWAVDEGHGWWLSAIRERLQDWLGDLERWPLAVRSSYGLALSRSALERGSGADQEQIETARALLSGLTDQASVHNGQALTEQGEFQVRSMLARLNESLGLFDDAANELQCNLNEGFRLRHYSSDMAHRRSMQALIGTDAMRLNRVRLRRLGDKEAPPSLRIDMFDTIETTRCRVLMDMIASNEPMQVSPSDVIDFGSKDSLDFVKDARGNDRYAQFSLVSDHDRFEGFWLLMTGSKDGVPEFTRCSYDEPLSIFESVERALELSVHDARTSGGLMESLRRFCDWFEGTLRSALARADVAGEPLYVSASDYLLSLPWSFAGAMREPAVPVVNVFMGGTATSLARSTRLRCDRVCAFLDPLGDLIEVHGVAEAVRRASPDAKQTLVRVGEGATRSSFVRDSEHADLLIYVGHGAKVENASCLLFSFGQSLVPSDLTPTRSSSSAQGPGARVAIVLACWGGVLDLQQGRANWEPDGLAYRLKSRGFDYVITALWPISPRVASLFISAFLSHAAQRSVPEAFVQAYRGLVDQIGGEAAHRDGGCIQLIG